MTPSLTRRGLRSAGVKPAGAGAAATSMVGVGARGEAAEVLGPDAAALTLKVNGAVQKVTVDRGCFERE